MHEGVARYIGIIRYGIKIIMVPRYRAARLLRRAEASDEMRKDGIQRLAVLISGQADRFAHRHMQLNASALLGLTLAPDVHMVLSQTNYARLRQPAAGTSYPSSLPAMQLEPLLIAWLVHEQRFQHATVKVISEAQLVQQMLLLDDLVAKADARLWQATGGLRGSVVHSNVVRWVHNNRMLWLRHEAFVSALHAESERGRYQWFLYLREDNHFLLPQQPIPHAAAEALHRRFRRGFVAVDTHCGFIGAPSDKIYFADRRGAVALFGNSTAAHVRLLLSWLNFGEERERSARQPGTGEGRNPPESVLVRPGRRAVDALHSEAFLAHHLKTARVAMALWPFARTDVALRHMTNTAEETGKRIKTHAPFAVEPCVRPLYYACGPAVLRENQLVPMCTPTTPHDKALWDKHVLG